MLRPLYVFSETLMYWISLSQSDPHIKTFSTLSGLRTVYFECHHS